MLRREVREQQRREWLPAASAQPASPPSKAKHKHGKRKHGVPTKPPPQTVRKAARHLLWVQCDDCLQWRRYFGTSSSVPDVWRCLVDGVPPFNVCEAPEEEVAEGEAASHEWCNGLPSWTLLAA